MSSNRVAQQFVQLALSTSGSSSGDTRHGTAPENLNWQELFQLARETRMVPLLLGALQVNFPEVYRSPQLSRAREDFATFQRVSENTLSAHAGTLETLAAGGIEVLNFKGPFLAQVAYGDHLARQFHDLDIIVPPHQYDQALDLLRGIAFRIVSIEPWVTVVTAQVADCTLVVDLHRRWMPPHLPEPRSTRQFWDRARTVELAGRNFRTLSEEDSLLVASMYFVKEWHNGAPSLRYAIDVAMLHAKRPLSDWPAERALARTHGVDAYVRLALTAACHLLGRDGAYLWEGIDNDRLRGLAARLEDAKSLKGPEQSGTTYNPYCRHALSVRRAMWGGFRAWLVCEARSARLRLFFVKPEDRRWISLPAAMQRMYVVIRPLRLIIQHFKTFVRKARVRGR